MCPLFPFRAFVRPLQRVNVRTLNTTSPSLTCLDFGVCAPQSASFALATTHSLDVLLNASRPYHRSPSACLEGTHGDRVAGDNANAIDFVTIASSLCATSSTRIDCYRSLFMSLVRGRKESKLVRSLVLFVKLGVRFSRRLAARVPSSNRHIPCIRTLRIGCNLPQP